MINIKTFVVNPLQENCYIVSDDTREAVIIDCGAFYESEREAVVRYVRDNHLTLRHLLCTHGHFDHNYGADTVFDEFGVAPEVHPSDRDYVENMDRQYQDLLGESYPRASVAASRLLNDGDTVAFGSHELQVIYSPGHSPGGLVFYCPAEHVAFTGDTLFRMSIGRTDLPGGSWQQLGQSLQKLASTLPAETTLYPGHGPATSMADELRWNPYMRDNN